jgi:hypothetical protein
MKWRLLVLLLALFLILGCGGKSKPKHKSVADQYDAAMKQTDPVRRANELARVADMQFKAENSLGATCSLPRRSQPKK